jgi:hypothetical protein
MRTYYRYLMIFISAALIWSQNVVAMHDQLHQHLTDDCVICKVVESGNDKVDEVKVLDNVYVKSVAKVYLPTQPKHRFNVSVNSYSRAPPIS